MPGLDLPGPGSLVTPCSTGSGELRPLPPDTLLIASTTKGGVDCLERVARDLPTDAADIPLPALGAALRRRLGLDRPRLHGQRRLRLGERALWHGAPAVIAAGRRPAVLVVAFDVVTEFVFSGFSALQALSPGPCAPFDRGRSGLTLGEGAAALLLASRAGAAARGRTARERRAGAPPTTPATSPPRPATAGA